MEGKSKKGNSSKPFSASFIYLRSQSLQKEFYGNKYVKALIVKFCDFRYIGGNPCLEMLY